MSDSPHGDNEFLQQITGVIEENLTDEQFGVSELAREVGMSRSNLLRKVKKISGLSVSQFIRQVRLERGMDLLKDNSLTVSEISYRVGFSSSSYFIKCFREHYGYPPGEAEKRDYDESEAPPSTRKHQLAAIMFTDIQGYTALMQHDESKALELRNRHREIFNSTTAKYKGKILQYYGDGTLSIFQSAIDAVRCGIELQLAFRVRPEIPVRVGIHSGDILISEEDIVGDGVNVASRIESLAAAGSVFISEKVYDEVKNQAGIQTVSLGDFEFKNVDKPMEVLAVANPGLVIPNRDQLTGKLKSKPEQKPKAPKIRRDLPWIVATIAIVVASFLIYSTYISRPSSSRSASINQAMSEKSIAVLPFINDSSDSANVYIINGLMESILSHLQKIEDLRVISRTSVEKYRQTDKTIPEIGRELGVHYFVEGSGQKIGDQILLTVQLIDGVSDQHLWSEQFDRRVADIFGLQREIAKKIAGEIQVIITPEEAQRLDETPTDNVAAYEAFLQGRELYYQGSRENWEQAIQYYKQAIELDPTFALAYAGVAITYYVLDYEQAAKQYATEINRYADKALLYDAQSPYSLIAKALYYIYNGDYTAALPHLEKALEYNPNSAEVINLLADFYTRYVPNTEKYLEYALRGIQLDIAAQDSTTASYTFLYVSNAFAQFGFVEEAEKYINRSLAYNPNNLYSAYVKAFILYAKNQDLARTKARLLETLNLDTTRLDVLQEVAKICYYMRDFEEAYRYYKEFTDIREALNLDIYPGEDAKIALVFRKAGKPAEAEKLIGRFRAYAENDRSIYQNMNQALLSAYEGNPQRAIEQMRAFSKEENYHYWTLLFLEKDPLMDAVKKQPAFEDIMRELERKFWNRHEEVRAALEERRLI